MVVRPARAELPDSYRRDPQHRRRTGRTLAPAGRFPDAMGIEPCRELRGRPCKAQDAPLKNWRLITCWGLRYVEITRATEWIAEAVLEGGAEGSVGTTDDKATLLDVRIYAVPAAA